MANRCCVPGCNVPGWRNDYGRDDFVCDGCRTAGLRQAPLPPYAGCADPGAHRYYYVRTEAMTVTPRDYGGYQKPTTPEAMLAWWGARGWRLVSWAETETVVRAVWELPVEKPDIPRHASE